MSQDKMGLMYLNEPRGWWEGQGIRTKVKQPTSPSQWWERTQAASVKSRNALSILIGLFSIFIGRLVLKQMTAFFSPWTKSEIFSSVMYRWVCSTWIAASGRMAQQALFLTDANLPWPSSITHWCPICSSHPQPIKRLMVISTRHHLPMADVKKRQGLCEERVILGLTFRPGYACYHAPPPPL